MEGAGCAWVAAAAVPGPALAAVVAEEHVRALTEGASMEAAVRDPVSAEGVASRDRTSAVEEGEGDARILVVVADPRDPILVARDHVPISAAEILAVATWGSETGRRSAVAIALR